MRKWLGLSFAAVFCFPHLIQGQSVLINEVQVKPPTDALSSQFQSMFNCPNPTFGAEWVELYNPDPCFAMDVSGYILGARTIATNYGAIMIPAGTTIPPLGFLVLGGPNAPSVDINLTSLCGTPNICTDGDSRWYMENGDGWVALYRPTGAVADAVYWTFSSGETIKLTTDSDFASGPCTPSGSGAGVLASASSMGTTIKYAGAGPSINQTVYRTTDGGATWANNGTPTPKACNATCSTTSCGPLDALVLALDGSSLKGANYLHWFDGLEARASTYHLQRANAEGEFVTLASVDASSAPGGYYHWIDSDPVAGRNVYRVVSRDSQGNILHASSPLTLVSVASHEKVVQVSPNPCKGELLVTLMQDAGPGTWSLWNGQGDLMMSLSFTAEDAVTQLHPSLGTLPDGLYFWTYHSPSRSEAGRLLLQR